MGRVITKFMEIIQIEDFLQFCLHFFSPISNAISSEVTGLFDFKLYVRHPVEGPYHSYGNYADAVIFSAGHQGPWASCWHYVACRISLGLVTCKSLASVNLALLTAMVVSTVHG